MRTRELETEKTMNAFSPKWVKTAIPNLCYGNDGHADFASQMLGCPRCFLCARLRCLPQRRVLLHFLKRASCGSAGRSTGRGRGVWLTE
jgi:hypothetical protein